MLKHAKVHGSGPDKVGGPDWDADHVVDDAAALRTALGVPGISSFAGVLGASGHMEIPVSGTRPLQIRWGTGTTNATPTSGTTHTFAAPFTTACRGVIMQNTSTSASGLTLFAAVASTSTFVSAASSASINFFYIAIGD